MSRIPTAAALLSLALCGCTFSRSVVNPHHRRHDTSWIVPGKTTRAEVIEKFGLPPGDMQGRGGIKGDTMRWLTRDSLTGKLEAGHIVTPTFEISREHHRHDLLIAFDADGRVRLVSRTESVNGRKRILDFREAE